MSSTDQPSLAESLPFLSAWEWELLGTPVEATVLDPGPFPRTASVIRIERDERLRLTFAFHGEPAARLGDIVSSKAWKPDGGKFVKLLSDVPPVVALWEERNAEITVLGPHWLRLHGDASGPEAIHGKAERVLYRAREDRRPSSLSLWLANGPPGGEFFWPRVSERCAETAFTTSRGSLIRRDGTSRHETHSRDHALLDLGSWGKVVLAEVPSRLPGSPVPKRTSREHSHCLSLEFHAGLAPIPEPESWDDLVRAVGFAMGRKLVLLGATAFGEDHRIAWADARCPTGAFLPDAFEERSRPPTAVAAPDADAERLRFLAEDRLAELVRTMLDATRDAKLAPAMARALDLLWLASSSSLRLAPTLCMTAIDEIATAWLEATPSCAGEPLPGSGGGRRELFFQSTGLARGAVEKAVKEFRDDVTHGRRCTIEPACLEPLVWTKRAACTLLHRVLLRAIRFQGTYVDYSTWAETERDLDAALGGPKGDGQPASWDDGPS
ncbi:MAG: hypothetical protein QME96_01880 [Myxococcota bacterium]|nr:hypothetical protein [Myxococcota bacterium]